MTIAMVNENAHRRHRKALQIPRDTPDLQLAMKRALWLRGLSTVDLAQRTGHCKSFWESRLQKQRRNVYRLAAGDIKAFCRVLNIAPSEARRLHRLGAIAAGWEIGHE